MLSYLPPVLVLMAAGYLLVSYIWQVGWAAAAANTFTYCGLFGAWSAALTSKQLVWPWETLVRLVYHAGNMLQRIGLWLQAKITLPWLCFGCVAAIAAVTITAVVASRQH